MPSTFSPKRRMWKFADDGESWFAGNPLLSAILNVYTLLVPGNESFYIRVLNHATTDCSDASFKARVNHFVQQESLHGVAHRAAWKHLGISESCVNKFVSATNFVLYKIAEPLQPFHFKLAVVAAVEHLNAFWANFFISRDLLRDCDPEMKALFYWHFSEEIEHKGVANEALHRECSSRFLRVFAGVFAFSTFYALLLIGSIYIMAMSKTLLSRRNLTGISFLFRSGFIRFNAHHVLRYCKKDFSPWELHDYHLAHEGVSRANEKSPNRLAAELKRRSAATIVECPPAKNTRRSRGTHAVVNAAV